MRNELPYRQPGEEIKNVEKIDNAALDMQVEKLINHIFAANRFSIDAFIAQVNMQSLETKKEWLPDEEQKELLASFTRLLDSGKIGRDGNMFHIKTAA